MRDPPTLARSPCAGVQVPRRADAFTDLRRLHELCCAGASRLLREAALRTVVTKWIRSASPTVTSPVRAGSLASGACPAAA